jgi:RNA polymerase sigma-70 factor (ECF subfamily)
MAWRWMGSRHDAEDLAQDVCVKLARAIRSFRHDARFETWLYRLVYTTAVDHVRHRQRTRSTADNVIPLFAPNHENSPEDEMINCEVWDEIAKLPRRQRDAVLLVHGQDLSHAEASAIMGCSESTVSGHLFAARKQLKERLTASG